MINLEECMGKLSFDRKIGEGGYREVYQITPEICVKTIKNDEKNYGLLKKKIPNRAYILLKFGILNPGHV